jgi:sodium-dependent dicarboxylate transporter 2/3/5
MSDPIRIDAQGNISIKINVHVFVKVFVTLALAIAFSCSLAMSLPISAPPNAIAFATHAIETREMAKYGTFISVLGVICVFLFLLILRQIWD